MITAIIAHKDYKDYLPLAIKSCLDQTIDINYTVIDDCSDSPPDRPDWPKIKENEFYSVYGLDNNKFIFLKRNVGPSEARNIGIAESWTYTDYFQILDADDIMLPRKCEVLLSNFNSDVGVVYADYYIETNNLLKMEFKHPYSKEHLFHECIVHSGAMVSKQALELAYENNHIYDPELRTCEDYDLWLRISEKMMIKHIPEFLTVVKEHALNSTYSVPTKRWQEDMGLVRRKAVMRQHIGRSYA